MVTSSDTPELVQNTQLNCSLFHGHTALRCHLRQLNSYLYFIYTCFHFHPSVSDVHLDTTHESFSSSPGIKIHA